jgi:hypothetical protein
MVIKNIQAIRRYSAYFLKVNREREEGVKIGVSDALDN